MPNKISVSETGHGKNLENFVKMRDFVNSWGAGYEPTNPNLVVSKLDSIIAAAEATNLALQTVRAPYRAASSVADDAFAPLNKLATRITRGFKAAGVEDSAVADLMTDARKLQGRRKSPAPSDDPSTPLVNEAEKGHSASQMSRASRVAALDAMVATLEQHPVYKPNEKDLQVAALKALSADLKTKTDAVNAAFVAVSNEMNTRDEIFYINPDNLIKTAQNVKNYVISAFGTNSPEHIQIRGLEFKVIKRRSQK